MKDSCSWVGSVIAKSLVARGLDQLGVLLSAVVALLGEQPVDDDFLDTFVVGNDDPILAEARRQWELEQTA